MWRAVVGLGSWLEDLGEVQGRARGAVDYHMSNGKEKGWVSV